MLFVCVTLNDGSVKKYRATRGFVFVNDFCPRLIIYDFPYDVEIRLDDIYSFTTEIRIGGVCE